MEYKNIYNYKDFLNEKNNTLNEGLLGKAFKFLTNKLGDYSKKIKAAKKIDPIIEDAKKKIEGYFSDAHLIEELEKNKEKAGLKDAQGQRQTNQGQTNQNESKIFEAEQTDEQKKEEMDKAEKEKKDALEAQNNPIMKAIKDTMDLVKKKIEPIIKDRDGNYIHAAKIYADAKLIQIEEMIIEKNIELFKHKNWDSKLLEGKAKEVAEKSKEVMKKLETTAQNGEHDQAQKGDYAVGDILNYTNKNGAQVRVEVVKNENGELEIVRISTDEDGKEAKDQTPIDEINDAFKADIKKLQAIGDNYIEDVKKTYSDTISKVKDKFKTDESGK